ncbi:MAG: hypothetical protein ACRCSZ_06295 [Lactococcus lactis]
MIDEKEYYLNNPPEPDDNVELDDPLCAMELFELQKHLVEVIENGYKNANQESNEHVAKFLRKNFI